MSDEVLKSSVSHEDDQVVVVKLEGELDCSNTDELTLLLHGVMG
ncbi:MAG: hypothetical protein QOF28_1607, partial [Actinomycetota bacterium]|nr:hypothetical protein [Actinomycetota bacterium]